MADWGEGDEDELFWSRDDSPHSFNYDRHSAHWGRYLRTFGRNACASFVQRQTMREKDSDHFLNVLTMHLKFEHLICEALCTLQLAVHHASVFKHTGGLGYLGKYFIFIF